MRADRHRLSRGCCRQAAAEKSLDLSGVRLSGVDETGFAAEPANERVSRSVLKELIPEAAAQFSDDRDSISHKHCARVRL
jgi:hypothetical protein